MTAIRWRPIAGACSGSPIACSAAAATRKTSCRMPISALPARRTFTIPEAFLVTVVTRLCLDRLKSAKAQREVYVGPWLPEPVFDAEGLSADAATELADDLSFALVAGARPAVAAGARGLPAARRLRHAVFRDRRHARPHRGGLPATGDAGPPRRARRTPGARGDAGQSRPSAAGFRRSRGQRRCRAPGRIAARRCGCDHRWRRPQDPQRSIRSWAPTRSRASSSASPPRTPATTSASSRR